MDDCPSCQHGCSVWDKFATPCQIPKVFVILEAWTPASFSSEDTLDGAGVELGTNGTDDGADVYSHVISAGRLGPSARIGWFFHMGTSGSPAQMSDHWRAFQQQGVAWTYSYTAEELNSISPKLKDEKGRYNCPDSRCPEGVFRPRSCVNVHCAVLLASNSERDGYVIEMIETLDLLVEVLWVGAHLSDIVTARTRAGRPVLFAHYTPSLLTLRYSYDELTFPPCQLGERCPRGGRYLRKLASPHLRDGAIMAFKALKDFHLTQQQYESMLQLQLDHPGLRYSSVACLWMQQNSREIMKQWLPREKHINDIVIGGIFPIKGNEFTDMGVIPAVTMAMNAINGNRSVLADYRLTVRSSDGQCRSGMVMKSFIDYLRMDEFGQLAGILGPACSDSLEPITGVACLMSVPLITYSAEGALISNYSRCPYFFRTIGENQQFRFVYKQLLAQLGWRRVASLTEAAKKYSEYIAILYDLLQQAGVTFVSSRKIPSDTHNMEPYLKDLKEKNARIIIADMYGAAARAIVCEAYRSEMTAKQGYVWFHPEWFFHRWDSSDNSSLTTGCTDEEISQALEGHLVLSHANFASDESSLMQEGISVRQWRDFYRSNCSSYNPPVKESGYASYAYDAVWTYALALDRLLKSEPSRYQNFRTDNTSERLVRLIRQTNFHGVSGHLRFVGPSRVSITEVKQWRQGSYHRVGSFIPDPSSPEGGRLELDESLIVWLTEEGQRPTDGSSPPCDLQPLADLFGTDCQNVLVMVVGLLFVLVMVVVCVLFYKRRYERKMGRLRELGLASAGDLCLDEWEVKRENIVLNRKLGEGAFGTVYGGEALLVKERSPRAQHGEKRQRSESVEEWCSVAVKTLKLNSSRDQRLDFLSEAEVMKRFSHTNIIRLLGVCTRSEPILTVMEFMLYGDLKTFLLSRRSLVSESFKGECHDVSDKKLTSMARDVACALSYLADRKYVHRDVACRNCLVTDAHVVKLADFGMTRSVCQNNYYKFHREGMLPVRWMAPESVSDGVFTPKSDVWSFGVLLYEMTTFGSFPFQGLTNSQVLEFVKSGGHVTIPPGVKSELADLLLACWAVQPTCRPDAHEIVELLGCRHPRLISPCLDVPLSVVQLEGGRETRMDAASRPSRRFSLSVQARQRLNTLTRHASAELCDSPVQTRRFASETAPASSPTSSASSSLLNGKYVLLDHGPSSVLGSPTSAVA